MHEIKSALAFIQNYESFQWMKNVLNWLTHSKGGTDKVLKLRVFSPILQFGEFIADLEWIILKFPYVVTTKDNPSLKLQFLLNKMKLGR